MSKKQQQVLQPTISVSVSGALLPHAASASTNLHDHSPHHTAAPGLPVRLNTPDSLQEQLVDLYLSVKIRSNDEVRLLY